MNDPLKLVAIVGLPGSGKSFAAEYFRSKEIPVLRFGDETDMALKEAGLPLNEKNERYIREKLRHDFGMSAYAKRIEPRIRDAAKTYPRIVLDGMRSWEEYVYLKEKFPQLAVVAIYASPEVRYERLMKRKSRPLTHAEARSRDIAEIENLNSGGTIAIADHLIANEKTIDAFINGLDVLRKILL